MKRKTKIKNYQVYIGVLAVILIVGFIITYTYKSNSSNSNNGKTIADAIESFDGGDKQKGIQIVESILKEDPGNEDAKMRLAFFYYQSNDYDKFLEFTDKNSLKSATLYNMMATIYQSRGDNEKAEQNYQLAIESNPKSAQAYINFAAYYQSQSKYDQALTILEQGLVNSPKSSSLLISAASVSLKIGDKTNARKYANTVLESDPENSQAKAILNEL